MVLAGQIREVLTVEGKPQSGTRRQVMVVVLGPELGMPVDEVHVQDKLAGGRGLLIGREAWTRAGGVRDAAGGHGQVLGLCLFRYLHAGGQQEGGGDGREADDSPYVPGLALSLVEEGQGALVVVGEEEVQLGAVLCLSVRLQEVGLVVVHLLVGRAGHVVVALVMVEVVLAPELCVALAAREGFLAAVDEHVRLELVRV